MRKACIELNVTMKYAALNFSGRRKIRQTPPITLTIAANVIEIVH